MSIFAIKFLTDEGKAPTMGYKYDLPVNGEPTKWYSKTKSKKTILCCGNGYHASTLEGLDSWYYQYYNRTGVKCFVVEAYGKIASEHSKVSCENMRIVCEIPLKPIKISNNGDIKCYYERDNLRAIKKFCKENNYPIINSDMLEKIGEDKYGLHRVNL